MRTSLVSVVITSALMISTTTSAQEVETNEALNLTPVENSTVEAIESMPVQAKEHAVQESVTSEPTAQADETIAELEPNPDEMADDLNAKQQLQQTYTLKRTINGEVVQTDKRTVTFSRDDPYRATEAGQSTLEEIRSAFDGELLTRVEAFEEAKLDFTIADSNRDGQMTAEEFATLVDSWRTKEDRTIEAKSEDIARQRQYDAFINEIDPDAGAQQNEASAMQKFSFLSGMEGTVSREDYIREYLLDFDSMDKDKDTLLKGEELMRFRALNRGEAL